MGNWSYNPTYRSYNPIYNWKGVHLVLSRGNPKTRCTSFTSCILGLEMTLPDKYALNQASLLKRITLSEPNIAPENWGLEDDFPFGKASL